MVAGAVHSVHDVVADVLLSQGTRAERTRRNVW
eukprot:CAMPEP_0180811162 /NCGR_PEP_ID=MMETSP1038_2-20121128/65290_1 /TAXON_ID=632150 /ORGANISM="Azadinium spinosum, Strain 3D9" /LENGTH=32 /DNA_ID= /DNA_START= /DNA_END= /DNA_ORIENTATION=